MKTRRATFRGALLAAALVLLPTHAIAADGGAVDPALTQTVRGDERIAGKGQKTVVDAGHVDMGPLFVNGTWQLMVRDDTAGEPVWRHIDDVVFNVSDRAKLHVPDGYDFVGGTDAWVIPQTEIAGVPWLGWNTQSPDVIAKVNGGVTLSFEGHQGEGPFTLFLQAGNFGKPQLLANSVIEQSQPTYVDLNTHTHANWTFTQPGTHLVRISVSATLKDGSTVSDTRVLRFAVGGGSSVEDAAQASWTKTNDGGAAQVVDASGTPGRASSESGSMMYIIAGGVMVALFGIGGVLFAARRKNSLREEAERGTADASGEGTEALASSGDLS